MILPLSARARLRVSTGIACLTAAALSQPATADDTRNALYSGAGTLELQPAPEAPQDDDGIDVSSGGDGEQGEIVVSAQRLRGQLDVETAPLLELNEEDIAAEGVASIADLVTQVTNQTGSARGRGDGGRPIILVNGIRVGSFRELRSYPPEALARVEVFPEEVAQRFGFSPDRRVINLILKENYASREIELEFEGPDRGGYWVNEQEFGYLKIADGGRFNINLEANDTSLLTEAERDIIQTDGSVSGIATDPDPALARSLVSDARQLEANISWAKAYLESGTSVSANLNYTRNDSRSLSGLDTVTLTDADGNSLLRTFGEDTPLEQRVATDTVSAAGSISKQVNAFQLTSTFDASLTEVEREIDQQFDTNQLEADALAGTLALDGELPSAVDRGFDIAQTQTIAGTALTTLRGPVAELPGGEVIATFDLGVDWEQIESSDTRTAQSAQLTRRDLSTGANLVIPITSRRNGFADALGSLTFTAQAGLEDLSDFGLLGDFNVGVNWSPFDNLDLSANYIVREVASSLGNLGNPQVTSFNTAVFDFTNGESVLATVTTGGNPLLPAETQRDWKFAANWELPFWDGTRFSIEYIRNRSDDVTSSFPALTPAIEDAFADRVTRDAGGTLIALDRRPVSYAETRADRLQFILTTRGSFGGGDSSARGERGSGGGAASGRPANAGTAPSRPQSAPDAASGQPGTGARRGPRGDGSPPTEEQRAQIAAFREKVCADDGLDFLTRLVAAAESGEDMSSEFPGVDMQRMERMLSRARDENGEIAPERLAQFREFFCARSPRGGQGQGGGQAAGGEQAGAEQAGGGQSGGQQARRGGGFNPLAGPPGGRRGWRYFANLTYNMELENEILIAPGVPVLDQLDGDSTSAFGLAQHSARLEAGIFGNGIGMRLSGQYTGSATVNGSDLPGSTDIFLDDLATFDLRVFTNVGELVGRNDGLLKNFRVSFRVDNVFDARRQVTDENGDTPINYQPFLIDPTGRFVGIDLRKLF
ncbi:hypothetical protein [Erythrobacter sp. MTPC3]|uniref:hypothetical protein n=1 Tax=Erythrobacter sp. MTPC3 TaxID=3056564 RepID=UPI0036F3AA13